MEKTKTFNYTTETKEKMQIEITEILKKKKKITVMEFIESSNQRKLCSLKCLYHYKQK